MTAIGLATAKSGAVEQAITKKKEALQPLLLGTGRENWMQETLTSVSVSVCYTRAGKPLTLGMMQKISFENTDNVINASSFGIKFMSLRSPTFRFRFG